MYFRRAGCIAYVFQRPAAVSEMKGVSPLTTRLADAFCRTARANVIARLRYTASVSNILSEREGFCGITRARSFTPLLERVARAWGRGLQFFRVEDCTEPAVE